MTVEYISNDSTGILHMLQEEIFPFKCVSFFLFIDNRGDPVRTSAGRHVLEGRRLVLYRLPVLRLYYYVHHRLW